MKQSLLGAALLAFVVVVALAVIPVPQDPAYAQPEIRRGTTAETPTFRLDDTVLRRVRRPAIPQAEGIAKNSVDEAVAMWDGTWILKKRINPDGSAHKTPLRGIVEIDLQIKRSNLLGVRAHGSIRAEESGILDSNFFEWPDGAGDKPFFIESNGTWLVSLEKEDEKYGIVNVGALTTIKGTYKPYLDGLSAKVDTRYRLGRGVTRLAGGTNMEMLTDIRMKDAVVARGDVGGTRSSTRGRTTTINPGLDAIAAESCCNIDTMTITGNTMNVRYANGGADVWQRDAGGPGHGGPGEVATPGLP